MTIPASFAKLKASSSFPWLVAAVLGLAFILGAALIGVIQSFFNNEEFYVYQYAHSFPHMEAWQRFFFENGRPVAGIYWTYQYEILGHSPLLAHSLSFVLLLIAALAAAACFLNAWPRVERSPALIHALVFLFFINWISASTVLRISYDNTRLSLVFFFLAGLALQRWAASQRSRWLLLCFALFVFSLLTYENAAFLFPALLLLSWPLLPAPAKERKQAERTRRLVFFGLAFISGLAILFPSLFYSAVSRLFLQSVSTPVLDLELSQLLTHGFSSGLDIYLKFGQFDLVGLGLGRILLVAGILLALALSTAFILRLVRDPASKANAETKTRWICIYLASLWFLIFGPLPYILLGYATEVGARLYSSAVFGVFPLLIMAYQAHRGWLRRLVAGFLVVFAAFGLMHLWFESTIFNVLEPKLNQFYLGLREAVPNVRPNTLFIIINGPLGYLSCEPSLEMLYNKEDLGCALLLTGVTEFNTVRSSTGLDTAGLDHVGPNWIVINVVDNVPTVIGEFKPGDFDLPIIWESAEPVRTNFDRISDEPPINTEFYLHLLSRAQELAR